MINEETHGKKEYEEELENEDIETSEEIKDEDQEYDKYEEEAKEYRRKYELENYPKFVYAGFGIRFWAFLVDLLAISYLRNIILNPLTYILGIRDGGFFSIYGLSSLLIYLGYFTISTYVTDGRTLGKMIFGLRVTSPNEKRLKLKTVIVREFFGRFILMKLQVLYLIVLFTPKKQHLVDTLSETYVIKEEALFEYVEGINEAISFEN